MYNGGSVSFASLCKLRLFKMLAYFLLQMVHFKKVYLRENHSSAQKNLWHKLSTKLCACGTMYCLIKARQESGNVKHATSINMLIASFIHLSVGPSVIGLLF